MRYGKTVKHTPSGKVFVLVEAMDENKDAVAAVSRENESRYNLLGAWIRNWEHDYSGFRERFSGDIEECRKERQGYIESLKISEVEPNDNVRFITPDYDTKFVAKDLSMVSVNGTLRRVVYYDEYHFAFANEKNYLGSGWVHICEYAELCENNGTVVSPLN